MSDKPTRTVTVGDKVYVRDFRSLKWIPGAITKVTGPLSYCARVSSGIIRQHINNIRKRFTSSVTEKPDEPLWNTFPSTFNDTSSREVHPVPMLSRQGTESTTSLTDRPTSSGLHTSSTNSLISPIDSLTPPTASIDSPTPLISNSSSFRTPSNAEPPRRSTSYPPKHMDGLIYY